MTAELFHLKDVRRARIEADAELELITEAAKQRYLTRVLAGEDAGFVAWTERVSERMARPSFDDVAKQAPIERVAVLKPEWPL